MFYPARIQRNTVAKSHKRSRSNPATSIGVDAIIFENVRVPEDDLYDGVQEWCESALTTCAREATFNQSIDPPRWGNSQGLSALEKMEHLTLEVTTLKAGVKSLEDKTTSMNNEIINLNTKIQILAPESTSYLAVRNRFFSTYRRDIIGRTISKDSDVVPLGNKKAHGGDVITDRRLYENGTRFDDEIFEDLYGVQWARVGQIGRISAVQNIVAI